MLLSMSAMAVGVSSGATDNGDGTYSYAAPSGLTIGDQETENGITWEYVGQTRYRYQDWPVDHVWEVDHSGYWADIGIEGQVLDASRFRSDGTQWTAVAVDVSTIQVILATTDGLSEGNVDTIGAHEYLWVEPDTATLIPESYTHESCPGDQFDETDFHVYNAESIYRQSQLDHWEVSPIGLSIEWLDGGNSRFTACNGVAVGADGDTTATGNVLTAAHCIMTNGREIAAEFDVCAHGDAYPDAQCHFRATLADPSNSVAIYVPNRYTPGSLWGADSSHDIALITGLALTRPAGAAMKLSEGAESYVEPKTMMVGSYHEYHFDSVATCSGGDSVETGGICFCQSNSKTNIAGWRGSSWLLTQYTSINSVSNHFTFDPDGGGGFSGSPLWYCGSVGVPCQSSQTAGVVSVWSAWNPISTRRRGPKVRNWRALFLPQL